MVENGPGNGRSYFDRISTQWAAWLGIGSAAVAAGAAGAVRHKRTKPDAAAYPDGELDQEQLYASQLSILRSPAALPRSLQEGGEAVVEDLNQIMGLLLLDSRISKQEWQKRSGISERRFDTLFLQLRGNGLVREIGHGSGKGKEQAAHYVPGDAMYWCARNETECPPLLARQLAAYGLYPSELLDEGMEA